MYEQQIQQKKYKKAQEKKGLNNLPFEVRLKGMQQAIEQYQREIRIFKKFVLNSKK